MRAGEGVRAGDGVRVVSAWADDLSPVAKAEAASKTAAFVFNKAGATLNFTRLGAGATICVVAAPPCVVVPVCPVCVVCPVVVCACALVGGLETLDALPFKADFTAIPQRSIAGVCGVVAGTAVVAVVAVDCGTAGLSLFSVVAAVVDVVVEGEDCSKAPEVMERDRRGGGLNPELLVLVCACESSRVCVGDVSPFCPVAVVVVAPFCFACKLRKV